MQFTRTELISTAIRRWAGARRRHGHVARPRPAMGHLETYVLALPLHSGLQKRIDRTADCVKLRIGVTVRAARTVAPLGAIDCARVNVAVMVGRARKDDGGDAGAYSADVLCELEAGVYTGDGFNAVFEAEAFRMGVVCGVVRMGVIRGVVRMGVVRGVFCEGLELGGHVKPLQLYPPTLRGVCDDGGGRDEETGGGGDA